MLGAAVAPRGSATRYFSGWAAVAILLGWGVLLAGQSRAQQPSATAAAIPDAVTEQSEPARLAGRSLLLDAVVLGSEVIAVGERGHILIIVDGQWTQAPVPTRNLLTAITAVGDQLWAVGHDALILHSPDRGRTWARQFSAPDLGRPLFDVWFENREHGIAVGAYGLILETRDGGATWLQGQAPAPSAAARPAEIAVAAAKENNSATAGGTARASEEVTETTEPHLYAIERAVDGGLYIAGENGSLFRSDDVGKTWRYLGAPYVGSFFGMLPLSDGAVLVFGLRGRIYRMLDQGKSWGIISVNSVASVLSGIESAGGRIILVGSSGSIMLSDDGGRTFDVQNHPDRLAYTDIVETPSGRILLIGEGGFHPLDGLQSNSGSAP